ncbi:MAG: hypothetical protein QOH08_2207, partial [Chloroflexota bacterium]|nr:hypothetical protein [Chloroflexota bacterium]
MNGDEDRDLSRRFEALAAQINVPTEVKHVRGASGFRLIA